MTAAGGHSIVGHSDARRRIAPALRARGDQILVLVALVAITVFFIVYFSAQAGVRALDAGLVQMAQVMGASERHVARHIVWPGAVPYVFAGLRIAMPYSIGGAVIAELISANRGLGYLI